MAKTVVEGPGEPTREQDATFDALALGCASVRVSRMAPIGSGNYRATRLAMDGSEIDRLIVLPDGGWLRDHPRTA